MGVCPFWSPVNYVWVGLFHPLLKEHDSSSKCFLNKIRFVENGICLIPVFPSSIRPWMSKNFQHGTEISMHNES